MGISRVHRLIRLITLLQSRQAKSADELTLDLHVSRRTLFRDLKLLEAAGVPYYHERGKGYRIRQSYFLPPINLTVAETMGLMILAKSAEAERNRPLAPAALSAIYKLIAITPDPIREACSDLLENISVTPIQPVDGHDETRVYHELQRAIDEQLVCDVAYQSPTEDEPLTCKLMPYAMHLANNAWYVLGKTSAHGNEVRVLKLVRFRSVELTRRRFKRPAKFQVSDKLGLAWKLIPEGKEYNIEIEFSAKVATNVTEVRWHSTQQIKTLDDGRCRVSFRVDGLNEIAWWVCGYADQARVIKPAALRKRVREMHERASKLNT
ncbi:helix-turn-helix transcriptional regulator [Algisphaera agarilytica]|uniref:Proteasome accessory factor B n=1 Tax=Algisphaera agarilytica TaxID=1385975 RepID=A0A7X0LKC3_9BACT|nr:WYL domain-containing protein [Algisphaera agarilytica]MBB6428793.1 proteasome accessory factor B [Algisphaera agarilytica]